MKKTLLFTTLTVAFLGNAQSLTQANEAAIGETQAMFLCDSFIDKQSNVVRNGITWDYTDLAAYSGQTRDYEIGDATTAPYASDFTTSVKTFKTANITGYYNSTATERVSQGFVFDGLPIGDVIADFDTDEGILATYPMAFGAVSADNFSGTLHYTLGVPSTTPLSGRVIVMIDGQGTLNLPNSSYSNVIRVVTTDSSNANISGLGEVIIERTQYEYYDHTASNLPVFAITTIKMTSSVLNQEETVVLSKDDPMQYLGLNNATEVNFTISPNPSTDKITVTGEFSADAIYSLVDQNGRVLSNSSISNGATIDISTFENGMYFLNMNSNGNTTSKTIVKK